MTVKRDRRRVLRFAVFSALLLFLPAIVEAEESEPLQVAQQPGRPSAAQRAPVVTPAPTPRPAKSYFIEPVLGGGVTYEFNYTGYAKFGAKGRYYLDRQTILGISVSDSIYTQNYFSIVMTQLVLKSPSDDALDILPIWVTEQKIDAEAHIKRRISIGGIPLTLYPLGGLKGIFIQNGILNFYMSGVNVGLELGYPLSKSISLEASGDFLYDLIGIASPQPTTSLFGTPWAAATYGAAVGYRLSPQYRIKVGYDGQTIFFQNIQRLYHGLTASIIF